MADSGRLEELKRKFDENQRRYFAPLANEHRKAGDTDRAIELCRTFLPQQPSHLSGYIVYGQALFDAGSGDEAAAVFRQALTLDPENVVAQRYLGDIARASGDSAGAMQWYGKVLELDPHNEEVARHITAIATPVPKPPRGPEREAPPVVRPEPDIDPSAVSMEDIVAQPDAPQPERTHVQPADVEDDLEPLVTMEESFEIISWPSEMLREDEPQREEPLSEPTVSAASLHEGAAAIPEDQPQFVSESPFVTETLAELYLQQGHEGDALAIYRQLVVRSNDPRLHERIADLERRQAESHEEHLAEDRSIEVAAETELAEAAPVEQLPVETVREFFARIGARAARSRPRIAAENEGGLDGVFGTAVLDPNDESAAQSLASAFTGHHADETDA